MAHYALVEDGIVQNVIVADEEFIGQQEGQWIQTSYNTRGNVHLEGGTPLRGNFAAIGFIYDEDNDVFYPPQPYPSWVLNEQTWLWNCMIAMPNSGDSNTDKGRFVWNEENRTWDEVPQEGD